LVVFVRFPDDDSFEVVFQDFDHWFSLRSFFLNSEYRRLVKIGNKSTQHCLCYELYGSFFRGDVFFGSQQEHPPIPRRVNAHHRANKLLEWDAGRRHQTHKNHHVHATCIQVWGHICFIFEGLVANSAVYLLC
jgi:hypothetical protein